jgi:TRAP-type uncharacterized transport system substrate-binding protein
MNLYIIIIFLIILILYNIQNRVTQSFDNNIEYSLGIINNDITLKFTKLLVELSSMNIKIISYTKNKELLEDLNNNKIQFAIDNENNYLDSYLGLNNYKNNKLVNLRHVTGVYYNYYYFITNIINKNDLNVINNIDDLKNFYKTNNRHFIVGTEEIGSVSFNGLMILLYMYGFNPVNILNKNDSEKYDKNTIFYINYNIDILIHNFNENKCDGIFIVNIYNYNYIRELIDTKDVLFLDTTFKNTPLDSIYSYFYTKSISISNFNEDLDSTYSFITKAVKFVLLSNNKVNNDIVYNLIQSYYQNNTILINHLVENDYNSEDHNIFEPIDMIFSDKNSKIHKGAYKYIKSLGFILNQSQKNQLELDSNTQLKHYWKYDKIGLNNFLI